MWTRRLAALTPSVNVLAGTSASALTSSGMCHPTVRPEARRYAGGGAGSDDVQPALRRDFAQACEMVYASSWAREQLARRVHEPFTEVMLDLLEPFAADAGVWRRREWVDAYAAAAAAGDSVRRVELVLERFAQWYMARVAGRRVLMEEPWDWYQRARLMRRTFHFHYGPTNSGKTHAALDALAAARSGVYCAPLKALAGQVWRQLSRRVPCDLLIGDERRFGGAAEHVSCTVEMTPVDNVVDVGVIDEIQMIGDRERGWAWTRALLGLPAREIHLCGEERAVALVENILYKTRERNRLTLVKHERLAPLEVAPSLDGDLSRVRNGDCLVTFSRNSVLRLKNQLERQGDVRASFVYGSMPFDIRERQAAEFNAGTLRYREERRQRKQSAGGAATTMREPKHVLVCTDAIAYGLNMHIDRVVFAEMRKFDGHATVPLPAPLTKQIAGRAGRFGLSEETGTPGRYTTLRRNDMELLEANMREEMPNLLRAGLLPSSDVLELYVHLYEQEEQKKKQQATSAGTPENSSATPLPSSSFHETMLQFQRSAHESQLFFPADFSRSLLAIAKIIDDIPGLTLQDRILLCYLPLSEHSDSSRRLLHTYAERHAAGGPVELLVDSVYERLRAAYERATGPGGAGLSDKNRQELMSSLERLYRQAEMYAWLSWRLRTTFVHTEAATALKAKCVDFMNEVLSSSP